MRSESLNLIVGALNCQWGGVGLEGHSRLRGGPGSQVFTTSDTKKGNLVWRARPPRKIKSKEGLIW